MASSSIDQHHPEYDDFLLRWERLRHTFAGTDAVKEENTRYLPATSSQVKDGMKNTTDPGYQAYRAYLERAYFPDMVKPAVNGLNGVLHFKDAVIELPEQMEYLRERANPEGESLQMFLSRITHEVLLMGRYGVVVDVPTGVGTQPYLAGYEAEDIINWDDTSVVEGERILDLVVLDETDDVRDGFHWKEQRQFRAMFLDPETGQYTTFTEIDGMRGEDVVPSISGETLERLPFVFIGPRDLDAEPDESPSLPLADLSLVIYRGEADYRQHLFMQGQDTLVVIGAKPPSSDEEDEEETVVGAGARIDLPIGGDAKYVGVQGVGLPEQREGLGNDYVRAAEMGSRLLKTGGGEQESGAALRIRVASGTATLKTVAKTCAEGLQRALRIMAEWMGANPEQVVVTPNMDFVEEHMTGQELIHLQTAKSLGAKISDRTIHMLMEKLEMTQMSFEEELEELESEGPSAVPGPGLNLDDEDDEDEEDEDEEGAA